MTDQKPKRKKHNYTSELELKSLLIRIKNSRAGIGTTRYNCTINKYVKLHTDLSNLKYTDQAANLKKKNLRHKVRDRVVELSEVTTVDETSYERFGEIILLMIKNILKKPQFSGYTYKDDFFSDAVYKILKYLHNFDHTLISERSGQKVNAFAYISQIIHNSVLFIINTKKKENERLKQQIKMENLNHNLQLKNYELVSDSMHYEDEESNTIEETIRLRNINSLTEELIKLQDEIHRVDRLTVYYPHDYQITFDEYNELKELLHGKVSIIRTDKPVSNDEGES